jgi:hypothetical protein
MDRVRFPILELASWFSLDRRDDKVLRRLVALNDQRAD